MNPLNRCTVRVHHMNYEDSDSCGHIVELDDGDDVDVCFCFEHPDRFYDRRKWALELAREVVKEEWPQCYDHVDWDMLNIEEIADE